MIMYIGVALSIVGMCTDVLVQAAKGVAARRRARRLRTEPQSGPGALGRRAGADVPWSVGAEPADVAKAWEGGGADVTDVTDVTDITDEEWVTMADGSQLRARALWRDCARSAAARAAAGGPAMPPYGDGAAAALLPVDSSTVAVSTNRDRPIGVALNAAVVAALSVLAVGVVELILPEYRGQPGLGMPLWGSVVAILYAFAAAFGCAGIYATIGQQFVGGACILAQILFGVLVPGSARANILAVMLVNVAVSQAVAGERLSLAPWGSGRYMTVT